MIFLKSNSGKSWIWSATHMSLPYVLVFTVRIVCRLILEITFAKNPLPPLAPRDQVRFEVVVGHEGDPFAGFKIR
jgi:hypothetical protein